MWAAFPPSTASEHLRILVEQGMIACALQGRHRYFRIVSADVANTLEGIMGLAAKQLAIPSRAPEELRFARTCYDHMAGLLAVMLHDRLVTLGWLSHDSASITDIGRQQLFGIGVQLSVTCRRRVAFGCLDWSERRAHAGGQLGAAMLSLFEKKQWVVRQPGSRESVLTPSGRKSFNDHFGLDQLLPQPSAQIAPSDRGRDKLFRPEQSI